MDGQTGAIIWLILIMSIIVSVGGFTAYIEYLEQKKMKEKKRLNKIKRERKEWQI